MGKYKEYISFLIAFIILIFILNINSFSIDLYSDNIVEFYNEFIEGEYNELLEYNNINIESNLNLSITKVMYRNIYDFTNTITIYKGYNDNVFINDLVLDSNGLVGIVIKTYSDKSVVRLISSTESKISVRVGYSYGILECNKGSFVISGVTNYESVEVGDIVTTSGLTDIPGSIPIGVVSSVVLSKTLVEYEITVDLYADIDNINYLFIYGGYND